MATIYTENYHLGKQEDKTDKFDMSVITDNADKIDEALTGKVDKSTRIAGIDLSANISAAELQTALNLGYVTPGMFGAVGDGVTDDTESLQEAIDYCLEHKMALKLRAGTYRITKPLHLWMAYGGSDPDRFTFTLTGEGKQTIIKKTTNTPSELRHHDVDAVFIIANTKYKNGIYSSNVETGDGLISEFGYIGGFAIEGMEGTENEYAFFSHGWFFVTFDDITVKNCKIGWYTQTWNCYSNYKKLQTNFAEYMFKFDNTHLVSQTTMHFIDCHSNGTKEATMALLGRAYVENLTVDGGEGQVLYSHQYKRFPHYITCNVTFKALHVETSTQVTPCFDMDGGRCIIESAYLELSPSMPMYFKLEGRADLAVRDAIFEFRYDNEGSTIPKLHEVSDDSTISFENVELSHYLFDTYQKINYLGNMIDLLGEYNNESAQFIKYCYWHPAFTPPTQEYSISENNKSIVFSADSDKSYQGWIDFQLDKKIDVTEFSKVRILCSINWGYSELKPAVNLAMGFQREKAEEGKAYGDRTTQTRIIKNAKPNGLSVYNSNVNKKYLYYDISDIYGDVYLSLEAANAWNIDLELFEIVLIK